MSTYSFTSIIRNIVLNYKETAQSIFVSDEISCSVSTETFNWERSSFCNEHHGLIITVDLRLITNNKFRSLSSKEPNYREPNIIHYSKCKTAIDHSIDNCIENWKLNASLEAMS